MGKLSISDEQMRSDSHHVQWQLQSTLALSVLLMVAGLAIKISSGHWDARSVSLFELFRAGLTIGDRLMAAGVLTLALTPILRVVTLAILWFRSRDWRFVGVALAVLFVLSIAVLLGGG